jgi:3-hydroxyisobutyrate dehydrogenase-like beta-hydroxyacid dehydrogenase
VIVDAPAPGSKDPAERGQLLILAFGPAATADTVGPLFDIIGRKTAWLGEAGQGSQVKVVVNAYMSVLIEGAAETMALAPRRGWRGPGAAGSALAREVADSAAAGGRCVTRPIDEQSHPAIANIPYY